MRHQWVSQLKRFPTWIVEITPHLTEIAGFERGTGFYINPVVPEDAASILKGEIRWSANSQPSTR